MSIHLNAKEGQLSENVLMPGDPLRAKYIADTFLEGAECHNTVRGMYGYTGTYKGHKISIQSSGMGVPSMSIYATELIKDYGVKNIIRIGTIGAMKREVKIRDVVMAMAATNDSNMQNLIFPQINYAPNASFTLLERAYRLSRKNDDLKVHVGNVYTGDSFYEDDESMIHKLADYGVLGVDMETSALYILGAKYNIDVLSIMTVSDHVITGEETTAEERQTTFNDMITVALETLINE